jgi:hypothetical protein
MATRRIVATSASLCAFVACALLICSRGMFVDLESGEVCERFMVLGRTAHSRQLSGLGPIIKSGSARPDWRRVGPSSPIWEQPRGHGVYGAVRGTYDTFNESLDICALSENDRRIAWKKLIHCVRLYGKMAVPRIMCDEAPPVMVCAVDGGSIVLFEIPRDCGLCS